MTIEDLDRAKTAVRDRELALRFHREACFRCRLTSRQCSEGLRQEGLRREAYTDLDRVQRAMGLRR